MYYGIRYAAAEEALANGHQDAWKAYYEIHEAIVSHTLNNPYASLSHIYFPRISTRISKYKTIAL